MKPITKEDLLQFEQKHHQSPVQKAIAHVLFKNTLSDIAFDSTRISSMKFHFSNDLMTLPVTNQKQSGRCWIFAGLNVLREHMVKKHPFKDVEFSQNYIAFWDKFEKINYFIETMDQFLEVDYDDRAFQYLLRVGIQDGGQWDMFVSLVNKYGLVPKDNMDETASSSNTRLMNQLINTVLRKYAANARRMHANSQDIHPLKYQTLQELYGFLCTNFGCPPTTFDFEIVDKNNQYLIHNQLSPLSFYHEFVGDILSDYVSVIHAPTADKPFNQTYTVSNLGNVIGGQEVKYLNLEMKDLKQLVIQQILDKEAVWFGADVAYFGDRQVGLWDDLSYRFDELFEMDFYIDKADALRYSHSQMNHAMVFGGVNLVQGISTKWKIENSWGDQGGNKGYYIASDSWFDRFVYQAVIHKKHLSAKQLDQWNKTPIVLKPWDPMGSLALTE
jgi:bleomycin hydrolase